MFVLRDHPLCSTCLAEGRVEVATEVDHVIPLAKGGTDDFENLVAICTRHHRIKTAAEAADGRSRP
jgi:5-methylcytosine-specific restriction enzyme A